MFETLRRRSFFYMHIVSLILIVFTYIMPINSIFPVYMVSVCTIAITFELLSREDIRTKVILKIEDSNML